MTAHVSDREILLEAEGELSAEDSSRVRAHLARCLECRERRMRLESALEEVAALQAGDGVDENAAVSRTRLRNRLAAEAMQGQHWAPGRAAAVAAMFLCMLAGAWVLRRSLRPEETRLVPDPALTPGFTVAVSKAAICGAREPDPAPVEAAVAQLVFERYGIHNPAPRAYELDYLITPALGGANDSRNLWPQPYQQGDWNSRVKDALEDRLRSLVCEGKMDLQAAQQEIAQDWIAAYKKHFRTDRPLLDHLAFVKDRAWE